MAHARRPQDPETEVGAQVRAAATRSNQAQLLVDAASLNIIDVNDACYAVLGYPMELLLSLRLTELVALADRDRVQRAVHALSDGSAWQHRMLCQARRGDQSTLPISLSLEVDANPNSSRTKLLVSLSEVAESEQLYLSVETALAAANIRFCNWNLSHDALRPESASAPPSAHRVSSPAADFLRKLNPADRRETLALLDAISAGALNNIDTTVCTTDANGAEHWTRLTGVVPAHKPGTLLVLHTDVTETYRVKQQRRKREQALRAVQDQLQRSESELHELLALVPDFIVRLDERSVIQYASPSFSADCQASDAELVGKGVLAALGVESRPAFAEALEQLGKSGATHEFVTEETRAGKERHIWWTLMTMNETSGHGVLCLGRDVTERSRARRQLERQAKQLKRSNASLDDFASIVSHDLQAPMRHIANFAELLVEQLGDVDDECATYLDILQSSTKKLQNMTTNLLNYSRLGLQYDRMSVRSISELIADAIDTLADSMKHSKAQLRMQPLPELHVDPLLMSRLFQNLLSNSIKYCEPGISPEIDVSAERDGDYWTLYWADQGIGINPEHSERIFRIFTRLHGHESVYPGSGVGLALCKRIVESHGGEIWLDTDYTAGARFAMRLPVAGEIEES